MKSESLASDEQYFQQKKKNTDQCHRFERTIISNRSVLWSSIYSYLLNTDYTFLFCGVYPDFYFGKTFSGSLSANIK